MLGHWRWKNHQPRHPGGALRADAEVLFSPAGRTVLEGLSGASGETLRRALPSWDNEENGLCGPDATGTALALWRVGGAVVRPVAFGCRLCAARRTGLAVRVVRYAERWERACGRHGRWLLDADADQPLENLDLRETPEVVASQRRWAVVRRRARRVGVEPGEVFDLARAVVCRWWEHSLHWEQEEIWPRRLQQVGGEVGGDVDRWRAVARDAVVFPEVVGVAGALLDPAVEELVWADSGWEGPRPLPGDGQFGRRLGELVGRPWLGPLIAKDGGPLVSWQAAIIRRRRHTAAVDPYDAGPWRVRADQQPPTMAALLREQTREKSAGGSGTNWRSTVPPEQRMYIANLIEAAQEELLQLRGAHQGRTADAARLLLQRLSHSVDLLDQALRETALAAVNAGVALHDVEQWAGLNNDTFTADESDE